MYSNLFIEMFRGDMSETPPQFPQSSCNANIQDKISPVIDCSCHASSAANGIGSYSYASTRSKHELSNQEM